LAELLSVCAAHNIAGIIATNTTLNRDDLARTAPALAAENGGLSGRPLFQRACDVVGFIARESAGQLPIIGVGGIFGPEDAARMLDAGASLVQIYSGLVYEGPWLPRRINRALGARRWQGDTMTLRT
jgi:dihydroorotate dehydrogenase